MDESRGLCNYHSHLLLSMGDPLSHAILYSDLIKSAICDAEKGNYQPYEKHTNCRYCKAEAEVESTYTTGFIGAYTKNEFQDKYNESGMLCMAHLYRIKLISDKEKKLYLYNMIRNTTINKYNKLLHSLSEIIRKNDYRYSNEGWTDNEKIAWKRAVEVINGLSERQ